MSSSLILELQRSAMDVRTPVSALLRQAIVAATKLDINEMNLWAEWELNGYPVGSPIPAYRRVTGEVRAFNPYHGWIPVQFENPKHVESLSRRSVQQSVPELEHLVGEDAGKPGGLFTMAYPPELAAELQDNELGLDCRLIVPPSQLVGVLNAVRNAILQWALKLEKAGVIGEGMTFSHKEQKSAASVVYNIGTMTGVAGNVSGGTVTITGYASIHEHLKHVGVPQDGRNELETLMDEAKSPSVNRQSVTARSAAWLAKYGPALGAMADSIRGWFETALKLGG